MKLTILGEHTLTHKNAAYRPNRLISLGAFLGALVFSPLAAHSAPYPVIAQDVSVCDPNSPTHCAKPDSSGNTPVTIAAGSSIVGSVSINQTTPGTTNGVQTLTGSTTAVTQATAASLNATVVGTGTLAVQNTSATPAGTNSIGTVVILPTVSAITGSVSAATITSTSAQVLAGASRKLLAIDNESLTASIACAFGATAVLNTAGSFTIPAGSTRTWSAYPVPADAVNCISSVASSPATVEAN